MIWRLTAAAARTRGNVAFFRKLFSIFFKKMNFYFRQSLINTHTFRLG